MCDVSEGVRLACSSVLQENFCIDFTLIISIDCVSLIFSFENILRGLNQVFLLATFQWSVEFKNLGFEKNCGF